MSLDNLLSPNYDKLKLQKVVSKRDAKIYMNMFAKMTNPFAREKHKHLCIFHC
jgi:hypothetical protein